MLPLGVGVPYLFMDESPEGIAENLVPFGELNGAVHYVLQLYNIVLHHMYLKDRNLPLEGGG